MTNVDSIWSCGIHLGCDYHVWPINTPTIKSDVTCTKSKNLNDSPLVLQLPLPNPLKPCLGREWRCSWSSAERRCSNYIWVINNFIGYPDTAYITGLTVICQSLKSFWMFHLIKLYPYQTGTHESVCLYSPHFAPRLTIVSSSITGVCSGWRSISRGTNTFSRKCTFQDWLVNLVRTFA